ncbi:MAG: malonyl-CoA decarboxylase [Pseudomonadota bacterium]
MMGTSFLQDLIASLMDRRARFSGAADDRSIIDLCAALRTTTGENAIKRLGATILTKYLGLHDDEKRAFFHFLASDMDIDTDRVRDLAEAYGQTGQVDIFRDLMEAAEPARQSIFRRLNHVPNGTRALVEMREDLLAMMGDDEALKRVDLDFAHLFASWFNPGFLVRQRVSWESPASVLAKIIQYEAVHAINDWDDLKRRIQPEDRRCFAFFHPAMPHEPLVFVEVALCDGAPTSIQALLREDRAPIDSERADMAIFYSISNCQHGLRGISFGNSLIKQVVAELALELPNLTNFMTLSPVPGFTRWLQGDAAGLTTQQVDALHMARTKFVRDGDASAINGWQGALSALCARYLVGGKRSDGLPLDPVARFHLNNGAALSNILPMADLSEKGIGQSFGMMVNYHYDLPLVEDRHDAYASTRSVAVSRTVRALADGPVAFPELEKSVVA